MFQYRLTTNKYHCKLIDKTTNLKCTFKCLKIHQIKQHVKNHQKFVICPYCGIKRFGAALETWLYLHRCYGGRDDLTNGTYNWFTFNGIYRPIYFGKSSKILKSFRFLSLVVNYSLAKTYKKHCQSYVNSIFSQYLLIIIQFKQIVVFLHTNHTFNFANNFILICFIFSFVFLAWTCRMASNCLTL